MEFSNERSYEKRALTYMELLQRDPLRRFTLLLTYGVNARPCVDTTYIRGRAFSTWISNSSIISIKISCASVFGHLTYSRKPDFGGKEVHDLSMLASKKHYFEFWDSKSMILNKWLYLTDDNRFSWQKIS